MDQNDLQEELSSGWASWLLKCLQTNSNFQIKWELDNSLNKKQNFFFPQKQKLFELGNKTGTPLANCTPKWRSMAEKAKYSRSSYLNYQKILQVTIKYTRSQPTPNLQNRIGHPGNFINRFGISFSHLSLK